MACLCAPTSHEGSFRCRLHRGLNLTPNPSQSIPNHQIRGLNYCTNTINALSHQTCCNPHFTVRESSASTASASTPPHPFNDHLRFSHTPQVATDHLRFFSHTPQVAADHQISMRTRSSTSTSPSPSYTLSSTSPWSSLSSYRSPSSSPSSFYISSSCSSSSSRASASSSSPSPSSPFCCTRPPPGKISSSSSSPSKSPCRVSSSPSPSSLYGASGTTPSASHAAALAIMKQHSHNYKHGTRTHNRNILSPTSASKIGPSRLSRMAVACADEIPLLKDEQCISNSPRHGNAPDTFSGSYTETPVPPREYSSLKAEPSTIGLKTRSAVNKFKQSESSCRIVGSNGGSLIMPTVY